MKNFENPEYLILHELQVLLKKNPNIKELPELIDRLRHIINENNLYIANHAMLYTMAGEKELLPETVEKLKRLYKNALDALE